MYEKIVESSRFCATGYNGACDGCIFCGKSNYKDGDCYQQLHKAAANAIEELATKLATLQDSCKWIPVTERLPDLYEDVQILFPNNQAAGFYDGCGWCTYTGDTWYSMVGEEEVKPTHWAKKLPEPPKEGT